MGLFLSDSASQPIHFHLAKRVGLDCIHFDLRELVLTNLRYSHTSDALADQSASAVRVA
jgi:hypothetical protein